MPATRPRGSKTWLWSVGCSGLTLSSHAEEIIQDVQGRPKLTLSGARDAESRMQNIQHKIVDAIDHDDLYSLQERIRAIDPILAGLWAVRLPRQRILARQADRFVRPYHARQLLRWKHKQRSRGLRDKPAFFLKKVGRFHFAGTIVRLYRIPRGEHGRRNGSRQLHSLRFFPLAYESFRRVDVYSRKYP